MRTRKQGCGKALRNASIFRERGVAGSETVRNGVVRESAAALSRRGGPLRPQPLNLRPHLRRRHRGVQGRRHGRPRRHTLPHRRVLRRGPVPVPVHKPCRRYPNANTKAQEGTRGQERQGDKSGRSQSGESPSKHMNKSEPSAVPSSDQIRPSFTSPSGQATDSWNINNG